MTKEAFIVLTNLPCDAINLEYKYIYVAVKRQKKKHFCTSKFLSCTDGRVVLEWHVHICTFFFCLFTVTLPACYPSITAPLRHVTFLQPRAWASQQSMLGSSSHRFDVVFENKLSFYSFNIQDRIELLKRKKKHIKVFKDQGSQ